MTVFTSFLDSDILQPTLPCPEDLPSFLPSLLLQTPKPFLKRDLLFADSDHTILDTLPVLHRAFDVVMVRATEA